MMSIRSFTACLTAAWSLALLGTLPALANAKFFASEAVPAKQAAAAIPVAPSDAFWSGVSAQTFTIYPQKTVRLNDKRANAALEQAKPEAIEVKAAYSDQELGVWISWKDQTRTLFTRNETNSFGDSVAIEVPVKFGEKERLPYIGMGDEAAPVRVYMQRAAEEGVLANEYVAKGFGSLTRVQSKVTKMKMEYDAKGHRWRAVFVRPLAAGGHSVQSALVPIAFAVWDGDRNERGGNKYLTSWKFLNLSTMKTSAAYLKRISYGFAPGDLGSAEQGKLRVSQMCVGCHWVGGNHTAAQGIAPDLSNIGGISTYAYLRDSVSTPNDPVVRNLNINRHYNKAASPDAFKAYPNNEMYKWYFAGADGKKMSKMPNFGLPPKDVADVVAYLKTLDGTQP